VGVSGILPLGLPPAPAEIDVDHIPEWCKDFRQPYGEKEYKVPLEAE